jgi:membrane dipeptidase
MLVVDGHLDLAWNALFGNRDLSLSAYTTRALELERGSKDAAKGTVALPELRRGRVALCCATLLARSTGCPVVHLDYRSPAQACGSALGQLAYYRALERQGTVRVITHRGALKGHLADWQAWESVAETAREQTPPLGFVVSMESADPILDPEHLPQWWADGVRVIGPAHYGPGRYAGGTGTETGLTELGRPLLEHMQRLGIVLDVTHFSDQAFWQALEHWDGAVLASHNNCRTLVPHQRQFSDDQIAEIVRRDGVIGVSLDAWMLQPGWVKGLSTNERLTLQSVADHIDHICQLAGNARYAAIGSDLDGLFGCDQVPRDVDTIADLQRLPAVLAQRGYSPTDVAQVMHGNWLRLLEAALPAE